MSRCTDCAQFPCECGIQIGKCTCESTYAVTFCKDCGIGMTTDHGLLAMIDERLKHFQEIRRREHMTKSKLIKILVIFELILLIGLFVAAF